MLHDTSIKRGDPVLRKRIREIARSRVRYGARRRGVLLRREGWVVNHKRVRRMYREEGLAIRTKSPKGRRPARVREVGVLRRLVAERGKPQRITCDNGPEFVSLQLDQWAYWTSPSTTGRDKNCSIRTGSDRSRTRMCRLRPGGAITTPITLIARWEISLPKSSPGGQRTHLQYPRFL